MTRITRACALSPGSMLPRKAARSSSKKSLRAVIRAGAARLFSRRAEP
ncbi:MAG TPA: hypothetical protein VHV26_12965 [Rhizomicrobium sp.]|jgi:hypothetical protein|nr:hypothetical protein [Rhizomicrobium sp.]